MRRMVVLFICLLGFGLLIWLIRPRPGGLGERESADPLEPATTGGIGSEPERHGDVADAIVIDLDPGTSRAAGGQGQIAGTVRNRMNCWRSSPASEQRSRSV